MQRLNLWGREVYPERPGLPDCAYYMRTGSCGYGAKCRYNHPRDQGSSTSAFLYFLRLGGGDYPERVGEPPCQYYLRTGTCKFGMSCKFNHPKNAGGSLTSAPPNVYGYPLRPGEKECSYYLKTGRCKFCVTCKFDHPQSNGTSLSASARAFYPTVQPLSFPSSEQYKRSSMLPGSYVPDAHGHMLLAGVVSLPNWNPHLLASSPPAFVEASSAVPSDSIRQEQKFPERPGQPDCKYYMRTRDCKYGSSCRYNHPPDSVVSRSNCDLSPLVLPPRPLQLV